MSTTYVKHVVYWDDQEDYRPEFRKNLVGGPAHTQTLLFRLIDDKWVLLYHRDFCAPDELMLAQMNAATGQSATEIHYSWNKRSPLVERAEAFASIEADAIHSCPTVDRRPC